MTKYHPGLYIAKRIERKRGIIVEGWDFLRLCASCEGRDDLAWREAYKRVVGMSPLQAAFALRKPPRAVPAAPRESAKPQPFRE